MNSQMRWPHAFWLPGVALLLAACASGAEEPNLGPGAPSLDPSASPDLADSGDVESQPPPGSSMLPTGSTDGGSPSDGGSPHYDGGSSPDDEGSSSYDSGGYSKEYDSGEYAEDSGYSYDSGSGESETVCMGYAPPDVSAGCTACKTPPCQANGCYGGYWCETSKDSCHEDPPSGCGE